MSSIVTVAPDKRVSIKCRCGREAIVVVAYDVLAPEIHRRARCVACGKRQIYSISVCTPEKHERLGGYMIYPDGRRVRIKADEWPETPPIWPNGQR